MSSIIKGLRKEGYSAGAVGGAGLGEGDVIQGPWKRKNEPNIQPEKIDNQIIYGVPKKLLYDLAKEFETSELYPSNVYDDQKSKIQVARDAFNWLVYYLGYARNPDTLKLAKAISKHVHMASTDQSDFNIGEGQIYSTGGGAGQAYRKFTPKSSVMSGIEETITDPEFDQKIKNITAMNPIGSAAEKMILKSFLKNVNLPKDIDQDEWIDSMRQYLIQNREVFKDTFPELDFTDLDHMAQDLYVNHLYSKKQLEQVEVKKESSIMKGIQKEADLKKSKELTNLDKEINDMIEKIWHTEKPEMFQDSGRYLVYASDMGVEMDTDKLDDALDTAEIIAKRNIRSPVVVVDRKTKFPVVAFHGSESLWYHQNRLHEEELVLEKWSKKYKKSIDCSNPKGFSQKAHCAGRKARQSGKQTKSKSISK